MSGPDDFDLEGMTPPAVDLRTLDLTELTDLNKMRRLLEDVLDELRKLSHPAFEAKLLEEIRKQLLKQHATTSTLTELLTSLHHDLQWIKKHLGALHVQLVRLGIDADQPMKED